MAEEGGERTHDPTRERIKKAEEKGDFAVSHEVVTAVSFSGAVIVLWAVHAQMLATMEDCVRDYFEFTRHWSISVSSLGPLLLSALAYMGQLAWPLLLAAIVLVLLANIWQTGGLQTASKKSMFNPSKINPVAGMKKLFSMAKLFEAPKVIVKAIFFTFICYKVLRQNLDRILTLGSVAPRQALEETIIISLKVFLWVALFLIALAVIDYAVQRFQYRKKLRMTAQEVKEEHKEMEGDPQNKRRQRNKQVEISRNRMISAVRRSTVVVTNPTHYAVALRYDADSKAAPRLEAKGARLLAERIKEEARAHHVPVVEDRYVARAIYFGVKIGQEIPYNLYRAVAEILAHVYRVSGKALARSAAPKPQGLRR